MEDSGLIDGQISIPFFHVYISCLNMIRFIFGELVMFDIFLMILAEPAWALPSGFFVPYMV
jgi:hypothetical protein